MFDSGWSQLNPAKEDLDFIENRSSINHLVVFSRTVKTPKMFR